MKRLFKITSWFIIGVFFAVALSGCTKTTSNTQSKTLVVWGFEDVDVWAPIKTEFEKSNKGYTLDYKKQTLDDKYENRALNSILAGNGPDVWTMPNDWVYRHKDQLVPRPTSKPALDLDKTYVQSVKQSVEFDNKIYALTPSAQPLIAFYNSKMFDNALSAYEEANSGAANADRRKNAEKVLGNGMPGTWTDFAQAIQILTKKDASGNILTAGAALGTDKLTYAPDLLYLLMLQNGTKIFADDLSLAMYNLPTQTPKGTSDTPGKLALDFYTSFANSSSPNYTWNNSLGNEIDAFANGKVAVIFGYDEIQNTLAQKYPNFTYRKGSMPQLSTDSSKIVDYAKFNALGVSTLSKSPTLAWQLIDNVVTNHGDDIVSAGRLYTSKKSSSYDVSLENRATNSPEKLELATAQALIKGRFPVEFDNMIRDMIFSVGKGVQQSQNALDLTAASFTSDYLRKVGW